MLDLSPYMLIYNYGSKTFPLKNMQEIIINLLRKLAERHQSNKEYVYNVTIYLFSTHKKYIEVASSYTARPYSSIKVSTTGT
jgi:hypothetical protein